LSPHVKSPAPSIFGLSLSLAGFRGILLPIVLLACGAGIISAQVSLLSTEENYYEFLALNGSLERPYLNYRTLSDSVWDTSDLGDHPWAGNNLGSMRRVSDSFAFRVYGPELFTSYNSAAPYGQNDGVLWQGRGFNASLSAGARGELTFGDAKLELTFKPVVHGSQNLPYDFVAPAYSETESDGIYAGKASEYGYYGIKYIDAPQRFGDDPFGGFSWGDSEIRLSWKTLTAGFGTQAIWLGPAKINPILMSNNAPPFPKADIGLRKTEVILPWLGWDLGLFETRAFWGYLSESDWFDNDSSNDHNLLTGVTFSYAPPFAKNLTFGLHRTMLSKWDAMDYVGIFTLLWPFIDESAGSDERDQRFSLTISYLIPQYGFLVYLEWSKNDFSSPVDLLIRYPFHAQAYNWGLSKNISLLGIPSTLNIEFSQLESSRDYEFLWNTTFYAHHQVKQGYTNGGQWLGAGMGTGGNAQSLAVNIKPSWGLVKVDFSRQNIDNDYIWFMNFGEEINTDNNGNGKIKRFNEYKFKAVYGLSFETLFLLTDVISLRGKVELFDIHNALYNPDMINAHSSILINVLATIGLIIQI